MKRIIHICLWLLTGIFAEVSLSAQNPFIYHKGKTYKDVAAYRMEEIIDLNTHTPSTPILYEQQVPEHQSTLSYKVALPLYVRGIFFSRDSRPGDYQWPNNTNRLLPWMFNRLEDLTRSDYAGIPSNALPSASGDALLLELADGEYLFAKAIAGSNSLSWFQVNQDGTLTLYVSTLGEDALTGRLPLLIFRKSSSVYHVFSDAYGSLIAKKAVSALRKRADKEYFNAFDYLGWCTWEHYHYDIDETKILNDIDAIEASGIPIRYVLIDDGHIANKNRQLTSLVPDKKRFPNGWSRIMKRRQADKIRWIGLWYSLSGYWMGISAENDFPPEIQQVLHSYNGSLLPGTSTEKIETWYEYYVRTMKEYGFDFLKIDNQSFTLPLYIWAERRLSDRLKTATLPWNIRHIECKWD